jgi:hypothetical protein
MATAGNASRQVRAIHHPTNCITCGHGCSSDIGFVVSYGLGRHHNDKYWRLGTGGNHIPIAVRFSRSAYYLFGTAKTKN